MAKVLRWMIVLGSLTLAGCGGVEVEVPQGDALCNEYCDNAFACGVDEICVVSDEEAALQTCKQACEKGFQAVEGAEEDLVRGCLNCSLELSKKQSCQVESDQLLQECGQQCNSDEATAALGTWSQDASGFECDSGRPFFGSTCEYIDGQNGGCAFQCCAGYDCGGAPDVEITCAATGCQCTVGANQGNTTAGSCNPDMLFEPDTIWSACNL